MILLLVSVFGAANPLAVTVPQDNAPLQDERVERLEMFFQSFGCPAPHYVSEYVGAADTYEIDYRLLPAISVLESTCGVHQRQNNRWGWASARKGFSSFRAGLEYIARQLSQGRYYKDKTLEEKVRMYNPSPRYARLLKKLMQTIDDRSVASFNDVPLFQRDAPCLFLSRPLTPQQQEDNATALDIGANTALKPSNPPSSSGLRRFA
ncbi:MAG: hypothetical protein ABI833_00060 [Acidobacteriota bacterium]